MTICWPNKVISVRALNVPLFFKSSYFYKDIQLGRGYLVRLTNKAVITVELNKNKRLGLRTNRCELYCDLQNSYTITLVRQVNKLGLVTFVIYVIHTTGLFLTLTELIILSTLVKMSELNVILKLKSLNQKRFVDKNQNYNLV